jgi:Na+-transporting methylmalonyl-CoA/oxaloacetate decarboxylase gamma subunit
MRDFVDTAKATLLYGIGVAFAFAVLFVLFVAFLMVAPTYRTAHGSELAAEHTLTWSVAVPQRNGTAIGTVPETVKFKSDGECKAFGRDMALRMQDWVRGRLNADWHVPVAIGFSCELDGVGG